MNKRIVLLAVLTFLPFLHVLGQGLQGCVVDSEKKELEGVSVVLLGGEKGKRVVAVGMTDAHGRYALKDTKQCKQVMYSLLGYAKLVLPLKEAQKRKTVVLVNQDLQIKEVTIKSPSIGVKGDTLTYSASAFRQKQDKTIADVLKRLPGVDVEKNGTIRYQGRQIKKFYIEGMDLLGGNYTQASENISAKKLKAVQVYEHHQPIKLYKKTYSDQAALNIMLTDDAKNSWQGTADVGLGAALNGSRKWNMDNRVMEMLFARNKQSVSMYKGNSMGDNINKEIDLSTIYGYGVPTEPPIVSTLAVYAPDLEEKRFTYNDTHVLATNWLFPTKAKNELRFNLSGYYDKRKNNEHSQTVYTSMAENDTVREVYESVTRKRKMMGEMLYKINEDNLFLTNMVAAGMDFANSGGWSTLNGLRKDLSVRPRRSYVKDQLHFIKPLRSGKNVAVKAYASYTHLPSELLMANGEWQKLDVRSAYWGARTYVTHRVGKLYLRSTLGMKGKMQRIAVENDQADDACRYVNQRVYYSPKLYNSGRRLSWSIGLPLVWSAQRMGGEKMKKCWVETEADVDYRPNVNWKIESEYGYSQYEYGGMRASALPIYIHYRFVNRGNGELRLNRSHKWRNSVTFRKARQGFFVSLDMQANYAPNAVLYQTRAHRGVVEQIMSDKKVKNKGGSGVLRVSKAWGTKWMVKWELYGQYSKYHYLVGREAVPAYLGQLENEVKWMYRPSRWMTIDESSTMIWSKQWERVGEQRKAYVRTYKHQLNVNVTPGRWVVSWKNEVYHSKDESASFNFFSHLLLSYSKGKSEWSLAVNNLFDSANYQREIIYEDFSSLTVNSIRRREVLLKYSFSF